MYENALACIYMVIAVFILAGNSLTIAAIYQNSKLNTASNQFIFGLAIADLMVGFAIPYFALLHLIPFANDGSYLTFVLKCLFSKFPLFLSSTVSMGHLVVISIDRYISLVHPLQHKAFLTKRKAWRIMAVIWIVSTVLVSVPMVSNKWELGDDVDCMIRTVHFEYFAYVVEPVYAFLVIIIMITYIIILKVATSHTENSKKSIKVIAIIVGCFIACWMPFFIVLAFILYDTSIEKNSPLWNIYLFTIILSLLNSMVNPLIYAWKITDFRVAFLKIIRSLCRWEKSAPEASIDTL